MMRIGNLQLPNNLFLAPMAGITDFPFRRLAREKGCGLVFTEMVSAEGLLRKGPKLLRVVRGEHPISVQLLGSDPEVLADAAEVAEALGADAVDINMGCPARQVVESGSGVSLMRFPERVERILIRVKKRLRVPLSVKIRSGWDQDRVNAPEISRIAEGSGADAIILHPRTRVQGFRGRADWNLIRAVKRQARIPVIGNGDVIAPVSIRRMLEETGCDGVMIGRGALGNPWIFGSEGERRSISLEERERTIREHFSLLHSHYGEKGAIREIRRHLAWYSRGLPLSASFRSTLAGLKEEAHLFNAVRAYFDSVGERGRCRSFGSMENGSITGSEGAVS
jgi:nifR3 family TIM-barrel protein